MESGIPFKSRRDGAEWSQEQMQDSEKTQTGSPGVRLGTGISGLDTLLGGGYNEGRIILVLGEPGAGKTILCSQFLHWGASQRGEKGVFIGMNEEKSRFFGEMLGLQMDFGRLEKEGTFSYVDATDVKHIPDQARVGRIPVGWRELGLVNLIDTIQESIQKTQPRRIVLDSIADLVFRYPNIEERRPVILDIIETLASTGATCLITSELLSTGSERSLQPEEYLAEGVILLRTLRKGLRTVQVLKMRGSKVDIKPRPYAIRENGIEVLATEEVYEQS
jgi:circadian clock protein KaiC